VPVLPSLQFCHHRWMLFLSLVAHAHAHVRVHVDVYLLQQLLVLVDACLQKQQQQQQQYCHELVFLVIQTSLQVCCHNWRT